MKLDKRSLLIFMAVGIIVLSTYMQLCGRPTDWQGYIFPTITAIATGIIITPFLKKGWKK